MWMRSRLIAARRSMPMESARAGSSTRKAPPRVHHRSLRSTNTNIDEQPCEPLSQRTGLQEARALTARELSAGAGNEAAHVTRVTRTPASEGSWLRSSGNESATATSSSSRSATQRPTYSSLCSLSQAPALTIGRGMASVVPEFSPRNMLHPPGERQTVNGPASYPITGERVGVINSNDGREHRVQHEESTTGVQHRRGTRTPNLHVDQQTAEAIAREARTHEARALATREFVPGESQETAHSITVTRTSSSDES